MLPDIVSFRPHPVIWLKYFFLFLCTLDNFTCYVWLSTVLISKLWFQNKQPVVHVTCKNEEAPIKNEGATVVTTLYINFSDAQEKLIP